MLVGVVQIYLHDSPTGGHAGGNIVDIQSAPIRGHAGENRVDTRLVLYKLHDFITMAPFDWWE